MTRKPVLRENFSKLTVGYYYRLDNKTWQFFLRNVLIEIQSQYSDNTLHSKQVPTKHLSYQAFGNQNDHHRILFQTCRVQPFSGKQPPQVWASAKHMTKIFPPSSLTTDQLRIRPTLLKNLFWEYFCLGVSGVVL